MSATIDPLERDAEVVQLVGVRVQPTLSGYFFWKKIFDRGLAMLLLVPGLPIIGVLVALVRLTSQGPGIFAQTRTGKDGKTYTMYKIRSMTNDAEIGTGAVWTQENDPRVTRIGRLLRKLHLDEFPQLFNVLRGEMSFIGPRPERPEFVVVLSEAIPGYVDRLVMLPGITGLAQINLPPDTDFESVRRKQVLDMQYVQEAGLWLDMRMLLCTSLRLFGVGGDLAMRLMRVERHVLLQDTDETSAILAEQPPTPDRVLKEIELRSVEASSQDQTDDQLSAEESESASDLVITAETESEGTIVRRVAPRYPR